MKKTIAAVLASALILGACAAGSGTSSLGMGSSLVKMAVENQCRTELNKRNEWRLIALAMSAQKQEEWEGKICGCAAEEAPNQLTGGDLVQILDPSKRTETVAAVAAKTVTACFNRLYAKP